jgi:hypothetical protein
LFIDLDPRQAPRSTGKPQARSIADFRQKEFDPDAFRSFMMIDFEGIRMRRTS